MENCHRLGLALDHYWFELVSDDLTGQGGIRSLVNQYLAGLCGRFQPLAQVDRIPYCSVIKEFTRAQVANHGIAHRHINVELQGKRWPGNREGLVSAGLIGCGIVKYYTPKETLFLPIWL